VPRVSLILPAHLMKSRRTVDRADYGTVFVIAVIAGASHDHGIAGRVVVYAAVSSVVWWAVHVYASVLANPGPFGLAWSPALRKAVKEEQGVLTGAVVPLAVLLLGVLRWIDDERTITWSMWSGVLILSLTPLMWSGLTGSG
jgi:hypothetical protein